MACPTCSHSMQLLTISREATFYACPRCGTIRRVAGDSTEDTVPKLVERCREFQIQMAVGTGLGSQYASKPLRRRGRRGRGGELLRPAKGGDVQ
jgi:Zn-finger nucleic acid-binding protein